MRILVVEDERRLASFTADGGAGLGLSIVKRIVELHDGTISVASQPGHKAPRCTSRCPLIGPAPVKPR